jgi:hypothetical protein
MLPTTSLMKPSSSITNTLPLPMTAPFFDQFVLHNNIGGRQENTEDGTMIYLGFHRDEPTLPLDNGIGACQAEA